MLLVNFGDQPARIASGERIARLLVAPVTRIVRREQGSLTDYGSTGRGGRDR